MVIIHYIFIFYGELCSFEHDLLFVVLVVCCFCCSLFLLFLYQFTDFCFVSLLVLGPVSGNNRGIGRFRRLFPVVSCILTLVSSDPLP